MKLFFILIILVLVFSLFFSIGKIKKTNKKHRSDLVHDIRSHLGVMKTNIEVSLLNPEINDESKKVLKENIEEINDLNETIAKYHSR